MLVLFLSVTGLFAQSYSEYLAKAKQYESQKRWCYALGAYYDAMGTDESTENKKEAFDRYKAIKDAISFGNPGIGKFNQFLIHDEWKNLLIDAEKYGSSNNIYEIIIGALEQGDLDYSSKTASYNANISFQHNSRYNNTIQIIKKGYEYAFKEDWTDLPKEWPLYSVSSKQNDVYNVNGALVYARVVGHYESQRTCYLNAFAMYDNDIWSYHTPGLYDYKFCIVDENGKELIKGKRWLLAEDKKISFSGISPEVMDLIDNDKAYVNPVACYLEYGKFNSKDDNGGRTFIKNFPEVQLPLKKEDFICGKNTENKMAKNVSRVKISNIPYFEMTSINNIEIMTTEVTQDLYEAIMNKNPVPFVGMDLPVVNISWYEAIEFCNRLSELQGYTPVYSWNDSNNIMTIEEIKEPSLMLYNNAVKNGMKKIVQNPSANGYRLPTEQEWIFASGEEVPKTKYDEVGWFITNSEGKLHSVAQKKQNEYGLFDMHGNVREWCWDDDGYGGKVTKGGSYFGEYMDTASYYNGHAAWSSDEQIGFRIVRTISEK